MSIKSFLFTKAVGYRIISIVMEKRDDSSVSQTGSGSHGLRAATMKHWGGEHSET